MCRLTAYKGKSILIGSIVTKPSNSLLYQSRDAAYHPGVKDDTHHRNILVNGDGFGVSWYSSDDVSRGSCAFKFVTPAWSNQNLQNIGDHVSSNLIFAHIRAASSGHNPFEKISVSHENCHPFFFGRFTFMHNGGIPYFSRIKLKLLNLLAETFFQEIKGSTDSEHVFALFLTILYSNYPHIGNDYLSVSPSLDETIAALNKTVSTILALCAEAEIEDACSLNMCLTDGVNIIATRFRNGPQNPPSLYYNYGSEFTCDAEGNFYAKEGSRKADSIVISSAPLSKVNPLQGNEVEASAAAPSIAAACSADGGDCDGCAASGSELPSKVPSSPSMEHFVVSEDDIGSWILMPKDHMLIAKGDKLNPYKISSIDLKPVLIGEPFQGASAASKQKDSGKGSSKSSKNSSSSQWEEEASIQFAKGLSAAPQKKPKIMRFRSKL